MKIENYFFILYSLFCTIFGVFINYNTTGMKKKLLLLICCISAIYSRAQQVDTIEVFSPSMNVHVKNVVVLPADYERHTNVPVLYLLHGYGGNHKDWLRMKPDLPELSTRYRMIVVCPDGKNSWYWDSPVNPKMKYETYVTNELTGYMDSHYKTIKDRSGRAITGLSMGGHGGLWLGIRHQNIFGACGSISGGVDIRPFPENWEMKTLLGAYSENRERWDNFTVINQLQHILPGTAIIIDCGTDDFFYEVNEQLHKAMLNRNIRHDYISRPGAHDARYWSNSIEYQLLFFYHFFRKN